MVLPKYDVLHEDDAWKLRRQGAERATAVADTKAELTKGGVLEDLLGVGGGSVRIRTVDGRIQGERTFPGDKDPAKSRG